MKSAIPKKVTKMLWEASETSQTLVVQNLIIAAKSNEIKITNEDLQKIVYIVNSTSEQIRFSSSQNFENRLADMVDQEFSTKSVKTK